MKPFIVITIIINLLQFFFPLNPVPQIPKLEPPEKNLSQLPSIT